MCYDAVMSYLDVYAEAMLCCMLRHSCCYYILMIEMVLEYAYAEEAHTLCYAIHSRQRCSTSEAIQQIMCYMYAMYDNIYIYIYISIII